MGKHDFQIFPFISIFIYALRAMLEKTHFQFKYDKKVYCKKKWVFLGFFLETQKPKKKQAKNSKKNLCSGV